MKLEAEGQRPITDPQSSDIDSAVSLLSVPDRTFLILSRSDTSFVQAAIVGPNRILLECRDGSPDKHFRSVRDDYSSGEVVSILESYRRGETAWWNASEWRPIDVAGRQDRWEGVSWVFGIAGLLLMVDALVAHRRAGGDPMFGVQAMDAFAIGFACLMASAIIDLRKFRTMNARTRVRSIGILGAGAMVVGIQLIERFTAR